MSEDRRISPEELATLLYPGRKLTLVKVGWQDGPHPPKRRMVQDVKPAEHGRKAGYHAKLYDIDFDPRPRPGAMRPFVSATFGIEDTITQHADGFTVRREADPTNSKTYRWGWPGEWEECPDD